MWHIQTFQVQKWREEKMEAMTLKQGMLEAELQAAAEERQREEEKEKRRRKKDKDKVILC